MADRKGETDARRAVTQKTDARGQVSNTTYDAPNLPLQTTYVGAPGETMTGSHDDPTDGNFSLRKGRCGPSGRASRLAC